MVGPNAIQCKSSADEFEPAALLAFRRRYPHGENLVVAQDVERSFSRGYRGVEVRFVGLEGLTEVLASSGRRQAG